MKHHKIIFFISALLFHSLPAVAPLIIPRSQSEDSRRDLVGQTRYVNLFDQECLYGSWAFTFEYEQSRNPYDISQCLFGDDILNDGKESFIQISGSQVGDRDATDWLADYFGLPTDFQSKIFFKPKVQNIIFDVSFYLGLDQWMEGLYFRIHAPLVHSIWNLHFTEKVINPGTNGYVAGYFSQAAVSRDQLLPNFTAFAADGRAPNLAIANPAPGTLISTVFSNSLEKARISARKKELTRLSDIQAAFGWNFIQGPDHHFGLNIRGAAPAGNRPEGIYLFEPIIGNGHHWELGLGLTCHYLLFDNPCADRTVAFYADANLTTLFATKQTRTFDLIKKPLSRYMLVERLGTPVENLFLNAIQGTAADSVAPTAQFQNLYVPLANLTTFDVNVRSAAQFDGSAMLDFALGCWNIDIGYNFWARTCQKIKPACQCAILLDGSVNFALKGDAHTYGFIAHDAVNLPAGLTPDMPIPLSATESRATVHSGTNTPIGTPFQVSQYQNPGIDLSPEQWAMATTTDNTNQIVILPGQDGTPETQQRSTLNPVLITLADIDLEGAATKGMSNSLFGHISYNWPCCEDQWIPYAGVGGFIEFAHTDEKECHQQNFDRSCQDCAFSQWGIWLKAGVSF